MTIRIELVGLCGAGKSTFTFAIKERVQHNKDSKGFSFGYPIIPPLYLSMLYMVIVLFSAFVREPMKMFIFIIHIMFLLHFMKLNI